MTTVRFILLIASGLVLASCGITNFRSAAARTSAAKPLSMIASQEIPVEEPDFFDLYPHANTYRGVGSTD
jgi:hypothetical protein